MSDENDADAEFAAMQSVYSALQGLESDARGRVLEYVSSRLGFTPSRKPKVNAEADSEAEIEDAADTGARDHNHEFGTFAELYDATQPKTHPEKALVGGYWLQVCQASENFDSFSINKELKNLGEGVLNITSALDGLKAQKPALCLQLKKAGKSRQARKTYKLTVAGIKAVQAMMNG